MNITSLVPRLLRSSRSAYLNLLWASVLVITPVYAAPQVETPGFYITTLGLSAEDVRQSPYTDNGYFIALQNASAMAFALKVDVAFVVEKFGNVRVIIDGRLQEEPVVDMQSQVSDWIDSGMGGIAVHPDFPVVPDIVISYTHNNGITPVEEGSKYAKVARLTLTERVDADGRISYYTAPPTAENVIVGKLSASDEFPSCNDRPLGADCGAVDHSAHSFTFVTYGPDGKIYIGTGDGAGYFKPDTHALYAQVNNHLSGKILRVNPDGSGPEDNPFYSGDKWANESKVFAKGLRNPKSGAFDPKTGKLCVGNVGWYLEEGIFCLDPGDNAGWPCRENGPAQNGYQTLSLSREGERLASCPLATGTYVEPDYSYAHQLREVGGEIIPIGAVIGCARATAREYPDYLRGSCIFGDYVFDTIESVQIGEAAGNPSSTLLLSGAGLPTDVATDRKGRICYIAYTVATVDGRPVSEVRCLRYDSEGTVPLFPVPSFISFTDPLDAQVIKFDASNSYHTGGLELSYKWDFGDETSGEGVSTQHVYTQPGEYRVTLTAMTKGEDVARSTFQVVRVQDPNFVTPVTPSVSDVNFDVELHTFSAPVQFDVLVRNDKGNDSFRVLANIYDERGLPVAHLVKEELLQLDPGEITTVEFLWDSATELGQHTIGIEFYSEDWESWTLKYPNAAGFFVRNRAGEDATAQGTTTDGSSDGGGSSHGCSVGPAGRSNGSMLWVLASLGVISVLRKTGYRVKRVPVNHQG